MCPTFYIRIEVPVEELFVYASKRRQLGNAGVREDHVDFPIPLLDGVVQPVEIAEFGDIPLDRGDVPANLSDGCFQGVFASAGNEDMVHALLEKPLRRGQAHAGRSAGDYANFTCEFVCHRSMPSLL